MRQIGMMTVAALALATIGSPHVASAAVAYGTAGSTYGQNFNWTTGTATAVSWTNNTPTQATSAWVNGASSLGWYATFGTGPTFQPTNGNANNGGGLLSNYYYVSADTDRSLGGRPTGGNGPVLLALRLNNATGATLTQFTLAYALEVTNQRDAAVNNTANVSYFIGNPANWATNSFTAATSLNATTPLIAVASNVDGNLPANRVTVSDTITGLNWTSGSDLWIRWSVPNVTNGPSVGLDDVAFSAVVPEPTSLSLLGIAGLVALRRRR